jgi:hypothetical protein
MKTAPDINIFLDMHSTFARTLIIIASDLVIILEEFSSLYIFRHAADEVGHDGCVKKSATKKDVADYKMINWEWDL